MGTELFLKGMWLCQFDDCRKVAHSDYVAEATRRNYAQGLRNLGHDLLKIIGELRLVGNYINSPSVLTFLARIEAIVRNFYFPLYAADKHSREWANSRYPKRFYNDSNASGRADAFQSYPEQRLIVRLFEPIEAELDKIWLLRNGLLIRGAQGVAD
jgi:hypothetical protein